MDELEVLAEVEEHLREGRAGRVEREGPGSPGPGVADERLRARVPAARQVARRDLRQVGGRRLPHALAPGGDRRSGRPERRLLAEGDLDALRERLALLGPGHCWEREKGGDGEAPAHHVGLRPRTRRIGPAAIASASVSCTRREWSAKTDSAVRRIDSRRPAMAGRPPRRGTGWRATAGADIYITNRLIGTCRARARLSMPHLGRGG